MDEVIAPPGPWQRRARDEFDKPLLSRLVSGKNGNENARKEGTGKCECKTTVALVYGVYLLSSLAEGGKKTRQIVDTIGSTGQNGVIQKLVCFCWNRRRHHLTTAASRAAILQQSASSSGRHVPLAGPTLGGDHRKQKAPNSLLERDRKSLRNVPFFRPLFFAVTTIPGILRMLVDDDVAWQVAPVDRKSSREQYDKTYV